LDRPAEHTGSSRGATGFAIAAIALWAWSGPCFAVGSRRVGAMPYLAMACAFGVVAATIFHLARGRALPDLVRLPPRVILAGLFGVAIYNVLFVLAVGLARDRDLGQIALINYLWPIGMVLLSLVLLPGRPRVGLATLGAAAGLLGVIVSRGLDTFRQPPTNLWPHAMVLVGAFLWALYSVLLKRWRVPEEKNVSTLQFLFCGILAAGVGLVNGEWRAMPTPTATDIAWIVFCGVGPIGLAYYWWEISVKRSAASLIAALAYFIPILSAVLMGLLFRAAMSWGLIPGAILISAGAYFGRQATKPRRRTEQDEAAEHVEGEQEAACGAVAAESGPAADPANPGLSRPSDAQNVT